MKRALILTALLATACSGSSPTEPAQASRASITVTTSPTSQVATCVNTNALCGATVTVTIQESAGLGGNIDFINSSFRNTAGTIGDAANFPGSMIVTMSGTNRISARGSLTVPTTGTTRIGNLWSQNGGVGRVGVLVITVQMTDDRGNVITATAPNVPVS